jgi:acetoin utilization protein AcuA
VADSGTGKVLTLETPSGEFSIRSHCPPGSFSRLSLDNGLGSFAHYSSLIQKLETFERIASSKDGNVILALLGNGRVVGYAVCHYPEPNERWSSLGDLMYEMGAIEVSRNHRQMHLARHLVNAAMEEDFYQDKIAFMNGFCWHWDLDGSGLTMAQYRRMLFELLRPYGFREHPTNEPNIALRQENIFLARVGCRVTDRDRQRFRNLLFGILDEE